MATPSKSFRVGKVQCYRRGRVWYLCYYEEGRRKRPRVGFDLDAAKQLAAQTNGQLAIGARTALSFEPINLPELRQRWLDHHEHVLRSSVATINRYRAATDHMINFVTKTHPVKLASNFGAQQAEEFVKYLRMVEVAPNGHANAAKRKLLDKGIVYILNTCRTLFMYAAKRRHLSPYAENPFTTIEIGRIPVENSKAVELFTLAQEEAFLTACNEWQLPIFATLMLTGLRPGELAHLLVEDLDLEGGWLHVRNKPELGWQVKTRNERAIPLLVAHVQLLKKVIGTRDDGPVFLRQRVYSAMSDAPLKCASSSELKGELKMRVDALEQGGAARTRFLAAAKSVWWQAGALKEDRIRSEFIEVCRRIGLPGVTTPKMLRHMFATLLQDANVDPLIRNQLMGHSPAGPRGASGQLGMTAVYTHSRRETVRSQLGRALEGSSAFLAVQKHIQLCGSGVFRSVLV